MQPHSSVSIKRNILPDAVSLKKFLVNVLAWSFIGALYVLLPLLPLLASLAYQRSKYVLQYPRTLKKMLIHIKALSEGPVHHYLQDVAGQQTDIPAEVRGACTQCGNCCLDKRCVFLEETTDGRFQCGIYSSPLRRYSNCGSFPLSAHDIERYACPGYVVATEQPIQWFQPAVATK